MSGTSDIPSDLENYLEGKPVSYHFPKKYRLKKRRLIQPLFDRTNPQAHGISVGCVKVFFQFITRNSSQDAFIQVGFFVSKRIRRAVTRNRIKRLMREAYRMKHPIVRNSLSWEDKILILVFLFRGDPEKAQASIRGDLESALNKVVEIARHYPDTQGTAQEWTGFQSINSPG